MRSLRARVTLGAVAAGMLLLAGAGVIGIEVYADQEADRVDSELLRAATRDDMQFSEVDPEDADQEIIDCCPRDAYSTRIYAPRRRWPLYVEGEAGFPRVREPGYHDVEHGTRWRVYVTRSMSADPAYGGHPTIQVAARMDEHDARVGRLRMLLIAFLLLSGVIVGVPAWLLVGAALAPMTRIRETARDIAREGDLTRRLPREGPPEVAETADALNRMMDSTQLSYRRARSALDATRTFTADAGHELRTPLTSLRANLDVLSRDDLAAADRERSLRDSLAAHARLTALIEGLQTLARGDAAAVAVRSEPVELGELADAAVVDARRRHPEVAFELDASAQAPIEGDPDGLRMLLDNLLENGAVHGGRRVRVRVRAGDGYVLLNVDDDGPGIPDVEKARVFERFARGSGARTGTGSGLGLAIAAQQAELHGARLKLDDSPLGGARFELTLSAPARA